LVARVSGKADDGRLLARLGDAIRTRRLALGLSQEALADAAGIDRSHMGKIERGERNVTMLNLVRVSDALQRSPSEIMQAAGL
jgi:transcriptional regulator with XRE-family HTH domain